MTVSKKVAKGPTLVYPGYYDHTADRCFEKPNLDASETVPDDSYSIKELMVRFTNNLDLPIRDAIYPDEDTTNFDAPDVEKLKAMDILDRSEYLANLKAETDAFIAERKAKAKVKADEKKAATDAAQKARDEQSKEQANTAATKKLPDERQPATPA